MIRVLWAAAVRNTVSTLRTYSLVFLYGAITVLVIALTVVMTGSLGLKPLAAHDPQSPIIGVILGTTGTTAGLIAGGLAFTILFGSPLTREQTTGRLLVQVASPLGAKGIWIARSASLWAIAWVVSVLAAFSAVSLMRTAWAQNYSMNSVPSEYYWSTFLILPVFLAGTAAIINAIGLTSNAVAGSAAANGIYIGAIVLVARLGAAGISPKWLMTWLGILAGATVVAAAVLGTLVTKEKVTLACR